MFNFGSGNAVFPLHKNEHTVSGFKRLTDELPHYTDYSQGLRPVARCTVRSATRKTVVARVIEPLELVLPYNLNSPGLHIHFWASDPHVVLVPSKRQQQERYMWAANNKPRRTHADSYKQNSKDTCRQLLKNWQSLRGINQRFLTVYRHSGRSKKSRANFWWQHEFNRRANCINTVSYENL